MKRPSYNSAPEGYSGSFCDEHKVEDKTYIIAMVLYVPFASP
jgi:hypothetical protein